MSARFGPAGNSEEFYESGYKKTVEAADFVAQKGLNAYEVQFGRGVRISQESAQMLASRAAALDVTLSVHAPYYISLASAEEEKRINSVRYIVESARAASWCGARHVVVHPGGLGKLPRPEATALAAQTLSAAVAQLDEQGLGDIILCPETMGKINQLGDLDEVIALCRVDERMVPCVDFGHLNARTHGGLAQREAVRAIFDAVENALGADRMKHMHAHFSKIEFSKGGEVRHLTFSDELFGPAFEPVLEETARRNANILFICESAGTQSQDALTMKRYYESLLGISEQQG